MAKITSITPTGPGIIDVKQKRLPVTPASKTAPKEHFESALGDIMSELEADSAPTMNQEKLDAIKTAISEGRYTVDVDHLAENLLNEFFRD